MIAKHRPTARLLSAAEIAGVRITEEAGPIEPLDPLEAVRDIDPVKWIESHFYIPPNELIQFMPHQKVITRFIFTRREDGRFPFQTIVESSIKKSGKTTLVAAWERWLAETQARWADLYCIGNDEDQAKDREFKFISESLQLTPGYERLASGRGRIPGRWEINKTSLRCLTSNSVIRAISMDAKGEAGGRPYATIWTELWGFETEEAHTFWTEMTPVPTVPDSMRIVDSYAGFEGESELLRELYDRGMSGRQLTAGEMARVAARDKDGERYEDLLFAFAETGGDPDALVPCWVEGRMFMHWDSGVEARRNTSLQTDEYYAEEEKTNPPQQFQRIHLNLWGSGVSNAIPMQWWDACFDPDLPPLTTDEPMILSLDAGTSSDNFAAVAVTRHPTDYQRAAIRAAKVWRPEDFEDGKVDYDAVWQWIKLVCKGDPDRGIPGHRVVQVCFDPHQLVDMGQRIQRELENWAEPMQQNKERKLADRRFYNAVRDGTLAWNLHDPAGSDALRLHIANADAKHQKDQDSTMLFIKKNQNKKIDLLVAASMGHHRCLTLFMEAA